jgi:hypothetical protein
VRACGTIAGATGSGSVVLLVNECAHCGRLAAEPAVTRESKPDHDFDCVIVFVSHDVVVVQSFEPRFYWWEVIEIVKKVLLACVAVVILPGTAGQSVFALFVARYVGLVSIAFADLV